MVEVVLMSACRCVDVVYCMYRFGFFLFVVMLFTFINLLFCAFF